MRVERNKHLNEFVIDGSHHMERRRLSIDFSSSRDEEKLTRIIKK